MRYVLTRKDGGVEIMSTQGGIDPWKEIAKWAPEHQAEIVSLREELPIERIKDRTFRNAWTDNGRLSVDMKKARDIWREKLREEGKPINDAVIEAAQTPEDLKTR